jgi:hypothetical protein
MSRRSEMVTNVRNATLRKAKLQWLGRQARAERQHQQVSETLTNLLRSDPV